MDPTTWPTFHVSPLEPTRSTRPARDLTATRYTFFALTPVLFRYTWYTYYTYYILRISPRAESRLSRAGVLGAARRRRRTCKRRRTILSTRNRAISKAKSVGSVPVRGKLPLIDAIAREFNVGTLLQTTKLSSDPGPARSPRPSLSTSNSNLFSGHLVQMFLPPSRRRARRSHVSREQHITNDVGIARSGTTTYIV